VILSTHILHCYVMPRHLPSGKSVHVAEKKIKVLEKCIEKSK